MKIILLTGEPMAGKSEIGKHLEDRGWHSMHADLPTLQHHYAHHDQDRYVIDGGVDQRQIDIFRDSYPRDTLVINIVRGSFTPTKDDWDKQITNNGSLEELMMKVEACL